MKLNTPNKITLTRIFLLPIFVFLYLADFIPMNKAIAAVVFILAVSTDFIDGLVARKTNQITTLGKFLDPIADKLITITALILIVADNILPSPWGVIIVSVIICRELIIGGLRQVAASKNVIMAADKWGKLKMIFQSISIPMLIVYAEVIRTNIDKTIIDVLKYTSFAFIFIAFVLTLISGLNYLIKNRHVFNQ